MVVVEGQHCTKVEQRCLRWLDDEKLPFARCGSYAKPVRCVANRIAMHFCIDRYEYTRVGESLPENGASFSGASSVCIGLGKRLCTESEWNFACEGEAMRPYPYGFTREPVCNQDRPNLVRQTPTGQVLRDFREPSNARPACVSPFGVYDMVGNLDEPVVRDHAVNDSRFRCALKGGWWMPARNRCRPATTAHDDFFKGLQIGIRCCSNIVR
jgi:formylglycine-generating enzyme required for sulfatase activity